MHVYKHYTQTDLDKQYNARASVTDFGGIVEDWNRRSKELRRYAHMVKDVRYGAGERELLDIFPTSRPDSPLLVFFHGGYWQALDKRVFHFVVRELIERGIAAAVANYPLAPAVSMDEIVQSCRKAMVWLYRCGTDYGCSSEEIFVCGHSAGGHIAAMLMATSWSLIADGLPVDLVKGGCALSGLFDLHPIRLSYLNDTLGMNEVTARRNSPVHLAPACNRQMVVSVGAAESDEFHFQSKDFVSAWSDKGVPVNLMIVEKAGHFSMLDHLTDSGSPLFQAILQLIGAHT